PVVVTELVNRPAVVSPWELAAAYDALLGDVARSAPESVDPLREAFAPIIRAWRNAWARFGDHADGFTTYSIMSREVDTAIEYVAPELRLPNGARFGDAVHHHVLVLSEPAPAAAPPAPPAPPVRVEAPAINRPVFIVCSPRSG